MEKSTDILFWLIVPLLLLLPLAVHAETVRCKTELRRLCDSAQVCTRTTEIQPAVQYIVQVKEDRSAASITKTVDGKGKASWKAKRTTSAPGGNFVYSTPKEKDGQFSLSDSLVTFSYSIAIRIGQDIKTSTEVGLCLTSAP